MSFSLLFSKGMLTVSSPPTNFIWVREARVDFYMGGVSPLAITPSEVNVEVERKDPALDRVVGPNPKIFKLAEGFKFTEGPVWVPGAGGGHLLFSDPNANRVYKYTTDGTAARPCSPTASRASVSTAPIAGAGPAFENKK